MVELEIEIPARTLDKRTGMRRSRYGHIPPWTPLITAIFYRLEYPPSAEGDPHLISAQRIDGMPSLRDFM